jgi:hypothetical protein
VWIDTDVTIESVAIYAGLVHLGVDSFCTDFPLKVRKICELLTTAKTDRTAAPEFAKRLRALSNESEAEFLKSISTADSQQTSDVLREF